MAHAARAVFCQAVLYSAKLSALFSAKLSCVLPSCQSRRSCRNGQSSSQNFAADSVAEQEARELALALAASAAEAPSGRGSQQLQPVQEKPFAVRLGNPAPSFN